MTKEMLVASLIVTALFVDLVTAILLSLGVLTPDMVRNTGKKIAFYIASKPNNPIFKAAHGQVFKSDEPFQWLNQCVIEFTVGMLTSLIANILTFLLLLGGSLILIVGSFIGFILAIRESNLNLPILFTSLAGSLFSFLGFLLCFCGFCVYLTATPSSPSNKIIVKLIEVLKVVAYGWYLAMPIIWILNKLVSIFTMKLPLIWYRSLKTINSRGLNWLFTLIGILLAIVSFTLQLLAALFTVINYHAA